uniref:BPTI/Kunitz domain-containing protein 3 n=1 Tax=Pinctada maxima TaxID=104660 RepID=KCP3_PINMA|nr:RecName: Full=BPTI/Kunitz domain-containing protein 3; AltName: Full=Nacre serine protease inhibitor 2; Short=NSPI2; Flags: Precursor [Pinctada maxima]
MIRLVTLAALPVLVLCQFDPSKWFMGSNLGGLQGFGVLPARCLNYLEAGYSRGNRLPSHRFFFNSTSGNCEQFVYYGRGGNRNNFRDVFKCMKSCGCKQQRNGGVPCNPPSQPVVRYYYDTFTKLCNTFQHTGCGGNSNHFKDWNDCFFTCGNGFET